LEEFRESEFNDSIADLLDAFNSQVITNIFDLDGGNNVGLFQFGKFTSVSSGSDLDNLLFKFQYFSMEKMVFTFWPLLI